MSIFTEARDAFTHSTGIDKITAGTIGAEVGGLVKGVAKPNPTVAQPQSGRDLTNAINSVVSSAPVIAGVSAPVLIGLAAFAFFVLKKKGRR